MPDFADEQALIQRAQTDADAFQELYRRYVKRVYGYVAARVNAPQDAEDIVAEVFLRVIKNLAQLRQKQPTRFAAWLFSIARHAVADHYRRNGTSDKHLSLEDANIAAPAEKQPDHIISQNEEAARLYRLIQALPQRKREIITLRYYGGLRNQEIAVVLGIGEKTVSAYLSRALNDLQEKVSATHFVEGQAHNE